MNQEISEIFIMHAQLENDLKMQKESAGKEKRACKVNLVQNKLDSLNVRNCMQVTGKRGYVLSFSFFLFSPL